MVILVPHLARPRRRLPDFPFPSQPPPPPPPVFKSLAFFESSSQIHHLPQSLPAHCRYACAGHRVWMWTARPGRRIGVTFVIEYFSTLRSCRSTAVAGILRVV